MPYAPRSHLAGSLRISSRDGMLPAKTSFTGLRGPSISAIARPANTSMPMSQSVNTTGVGQFSSAMREDSQSIIELYSLPWKYLHAIATQHFTFFATSARPSRGEYWSPFVSKRRRRFVRKPVEQITTLPSGCAASTLRYTSFASGASSASAYVYQPG